MSPLAPIGPATPSFGSLFQAGEAAAGPLNGAGFSPGIDGPARLTAGAAPAEGAGSFAGMLDRLVEGVNARQAAAGQTVAALQGGQNVPLHQAVIALEEASVSFQLMVEVRNKLLESYQELMRLQI